MLFLETCFVIEISLIYECMYDIILFSSYFIEYLDSKRKKTILIIYKPIYK